MTASVQPSKGWRSRVIVTESGKSRRWVAVAASIVTISPGFRPRQLGLKYDYLVITLGNVTNFHGMPGLIQNAMPFRTLAYAMVLRNHLIHVLEEADVEEDQELRRELLTFVVAGGGFSGVEVMAELNDFVCSVKRYLPSPAQ